MKITYNDFKQSILEKINAVGKGEYKMLKGDTMYIWLSDSGDGLLIRGTNNLNVNLPNCMPYMKKPLNSAGLCILEQARHGRAKRSEAVISR